MNIDLCKEEKDLEFSDVITNLNRVMSAIVLYSKDYDSETKVRYLMKEWFIRGYMKGLDDYKKLVK